MLIDTNLLLVAVVAAVAHEHVERVGRTRAYTVADAILLDEVASDFGGLLVTPHILTEVSNLAGQIADPLRSLVRDRIVEGLQKWTEISEPSIDIVADPLFRKFGITDTAIRRAGSDYSVLTDDLPLYDALGRLGIDVINFTHVRTASWRTVSSRQ